MRQAHQEAKAELLLLPHEWVIWAIIRPHVGRVQNPSAQKMIKEHGERGRQCIVMACVNTALAAALTFAFVVLSFAGLQKISTIALLVAACFILVGVIRLIQSQRSAPSDLG